MMYNKLVKTYFFKAQQTGLIDCLAPYTVSYRSTYPNSILVIELYMQCNEDGQVINMRFKTNGSPYLIAALEYICRQCMGQGFKTLAPLDCSKIIKLLEIPMHQSPFLIQVDDAYKELLLLMNNTFKRGTS